MKLSPILAITILFVGACAKQPEHQALTLGPGDEANNGSGWVESQTRFAHEKLRAVIERAINTQNYLDAQELAIARAVIEELNNGLAQLVFRRGSRDRFVINGGERAMKTGLSTRSAIEINLDLLELKTQRFDLSDAIRLLVHEYGHHAGESDHDFLDALGAKIAVQSGTPRMLLRPSRACANVSIAVYSFGETDSASISDDTTIVDLASVIWSSQAPHFRVHSLQPQEDAVLVRLKIQSTQAPWAQIRHASLSTAIIERTCRFSSQGPALRFVDLNMQPWKSVAWD